GLRVPLSSWPETVTVYLASAITSLVALSCSSGQFRPANVAVDGSQVPSSFLSSAFSSPRAGLVKRAPRTRAAAVRRSIEFLLERKGNERRAASPSLLPQGDG